jgi:hypothetical protein
MDLLKKHTKTKNLKFYFRYSITLAFSMLFFVACQKSNSSDNTIAAPIVNPNQILAGNCAQCNFAQAQLFNAASQGTSSFPVTVNWQFIGEQTKIIQTQQYYGQSWQKLYSGMVYARGGLTIASVQSSYGNFNGVLAGQCQIPSGQYTLNPIQPGTMSMGSFELPQFEAIGGAVRIVFQLRNAVVIDPNGDGQVDKIAGLLVPMQVFYNGGTITCNDMGVYIQ